MILLINSLLIVVNDNCPRYNVYFYGFILCEFLNVLVATSVLFLTDKFLNHRFLLYGLKVGKANTIWRAKVKLFLPPGLLVLQTTRGGTETSEKSNVRGVP